MMTMWELLVVVVVFYFTFVTFNAKQKLSVIHLSTLGPGNMHPARCFALERWMYENII